MPGRRGWRWPPGAGFTGCRRAALGGRLKSWGFCEGQGGHPWCWNRGAGQIQAWPHPPHQIQWFGMAWKLSHTCLPLRVDTPRRKHSAGTPSPQEQSCSHGETVAEPWACVVPGGWGHATNTGSLGGGWRRQGLSQRPLRGAHLLASCPPAGRGAPRGPAWNLRCRRRGHRGAVRAAGQVCGGGWSRLCVHLGFFPLFKP